MHWSLPERRQIGELAISALRDDFTPSGSAMEITNAGILRCAQNDNFESVFPRWIARLGTRLVDGGDGDFDGADVVGGEVVDADTEDVVALDRDVDLLP